MGYGKFCLYHLIKKSTMAEINLDVQNKKVSGVKKLKRSSTRVDLTPMVDLGFLLVTFFVFTTALFQPTVMDILQPASGPETPVTSSGSMTFLLGEKNSIVFYEGRWEDAQAINNFSETDFNSLRNVILNKKKSTNADKLMFVIKSSDESLLANSIDLLDEMVICNIPKGHFAEVDITPAEAALLKLKQADLN